jgi:hypothetical protein
VVNIFNNTIASKHDYNALNLPGKIISVLLKESLPKRRIFGRGSRKSIEDKNDKITEWWGKRHERKNTDC